LTLDLFGIALSLLAIYMSGIYYAFWCHRSLRFFYLITVAFIFGLAMVIQMPRLKLSSNVKMATFVGWAAYGVVPTLHWTIVMGGWANPMVQVKHKFVSLLNLRKKILSSKNLILKKIQLSKEKKVIFIWAKNNF